MFNTPKNDFQDEIPAYIFIFSFVILIILKSLVKVISYILVLLLMLLLSALTSLLLLFLSHVVCFYFLLSFNFALDFACFVS